MEHKRAELAMPILEALLIETEARRLIEWDAALVSRTLRLQVLAARQLKKDGVVRQAIYGRLCQIDPVEAIRLGVEA